MDLCLSLALSGSEIQTGQIWCGLGFDTLSSSCNARCRIQVHTRFDQFGLGFDTLSSSCNAGTSVAGVPNKPQTIERTNSLGCNVARLAILELFVLATLVVDPCSQFWIKRVVRRDDAVAMLCLVSPQLVQALEPSGFMRIPAKANGIELGTSSLGHV